MTSSTTSPVHFFDVDRHAVPCGVGFSERSTKHVRQVTCPACVASLRDGTAAAPTSAHEDAAHAW